MSQQDDFVGKGTGNKAAWPEFNPHDPCCGREKLMLDSPLYAMNMLANKETPLIYGRAEYS